MAEPSPEPTLANEPESLSRTAAWGWLLVILLLTVGPTLINLDGRPVKHWMEGISLTTAQETFIRQAEGETDAWKLPTINGSPRVKKPPGLVWANMLAWSGLEPDDPAISFLRRARLVTVGLSAILVISIYWIGTGIRDRQLGLLAAMIGGLTLLAQQQARMASYDMHLTAWVTLSVAATLAAVAPWRRVEELPSALVVAATLVLAGMALAASVLSKGPLALALFVLPMLALLLTMPAKRRYRMVFAALPLLIAGAAFKGWLMWLEDVPQASDKLTDEYSADHTNDHPIHFYPRVLLVYTLPWTIWLLAGLVHPFMQRDDDRRRRLLAWLWLILITVVLSTNRGKAVRYILPAIPAVALLAAMVFRDQAAHARRGERDPGAGRVVHPHWAVLLLVSIGAPAFWLSQSWLLSQSWVDLGHPIVDGIPVPLALGAGATLLVIAVLGWLWHARAWQPLRAAAAAGVWASLFLAVHWYGASRAPSANDAVRDGVARVLETVGAEDFGYLKIKRGDRPSQEFLFYAQRIVPKVRVEDLADPSGPAFVLARDTDRYGEHMTAAGFDPVLDFRDEPGLARILWHRSP